MAIQLSAADVNLQAEGHKPSHDAASLQYSICGTTSLEWTVEMLLTRSPCRPHCGAWFCVTSSS